MDPRVHAHRRARWRPPLRAGKTRSSTDDGLPHQLEAAGYHVHWKTLGRALGNREMVERGDAFPEHAYLEAERALRRLRSGWCHHPPEYLMRGRIYTDDSYLAHDATGERIIRFDECGLCGLRSSFRISHVPMSPPGAPPWPLTDPPTRSAAASRL